MGKSGNTALIWKLSEEDYNTLVRACLATGAADATGAPYSKYLEQIEEAKSISIKRGDRIVLLFYTLEEVLHALEELNLTWSSLNCHKALMHLMDKHKNAEE